jgi:hypothetical protein
MRRPSPDRFALALGAYVGVLVGTGFALVAGQPFMSRQAAIVGLTGLLATWMVMASVPDFSIVFARRRLHKSTHARPGRRGARCDWLYKANATPKPTFGVVAPLVALFACGVAVAAVAEHRRAARVESHEAACAEWTARPGTRPRWHRRAAFVGLGVVLFAGGTALWFRTGFVGSLVMGFGISTGLRVFNVGDVKHLIAYKSGLTVRDSLDAKPEFVPWSRFTGYERTDDALVLRRRLPLMGYRCALDGIDDPDAVESALRERLG